MRHKNVTVSLSLCSRLVILNIPPVFRVFDGLGILYRETGNLVNADKVTKIQGEREFAGVG